ncbi:MAG: hypothetical protein WCR02_01625 [Sphaerochaetaceae bacterium]
MIRRNKFLQGLTNNWIAKICSVVLALVFYLFISTMDMDSRIVTIPVQVTIPTSVVAVSSVPSTVQIKIKGDDNLIYLVDPEAIKADVDFSYVQDSGIASSLVRLTYAQDVFVNGGISIEAIPTSFRVMFQTSAEGGRQ